MSAIPLQEFQAVQDACENFRAALEQIIKIDQREKRTCIAFDGAGGTYEVTMVDGPCACVARAALTTGEQPK